MKTLGKYFVMAEALLLIKHPHRSYEDAIEYVYRIKCVPCAVVRCVFSVTRDGERLILTPKKEYYVMWRVQDYPEYHTLSNRRYAIGRACDLVAKGGAHVVLRVEDYVEVVDVALEEVLN